MQHQSQRHHPSSPIIVDDESAIPESVAAACRGAHKGGLLASTEYGNLLASMSGYEKPPQGYAYADYGTATRPDQAQGYPAFVQPTYGLSYTGTHAQVPSGLPNASSLPMLSEDHYQAHDASYAQQHAPYSTFIAAESRHIPEVTSVSPTSGPAGRKLFVYLNVSDESQTPLTSLFTVMFGTKRCECMMHKFPNQSQRNNYAVSVDVPPFDSTGSSSTQVPLYLLMADGNNPMTMPVQIGHYSYTDATAFQLSSPSQSTIRKRKLSPGDESPQSPTKRPSTQNLRDSPINSSDGGHKISPPGTTISDPYANRPQSSAISYTRTFNAPHYSQSMQAAPVYSLGQHAAGAHMALGPQPPQYGSYPPYMAERAQTHIMPSASGSSNPPLIRTTALHGSPTAGAPPATFNPYTMYPSNAKAVLKLDGDLNTMAQNWTSDEATMQRRIVRFRRSQNGSSITASFEPVTPEEHAHAPGCIYVNCIMWAEKQECYITSVDTIQLLESLVAVRFTVEEKNRIRRNLEGFRPLTVSKTRPDCEEFFKVIMGFPSPKPRNIEKDVKVFPWRILAHALKKIIGKYSASYSSTAAALPSPGMATGRQPMPNHSSPSAASSQGSLGYGPGMTATTIAGPHGGLSAGMGGVSAGPTDFRMGIAGTQNNISWHQPSSHYATDLSASRGSWDLTQYLENTPVNAASVHTLQRIPSISQSLGYNFVPPQDWKDYPQRTQHT